LQNFPYFPPQKLFPQNSELNPKNENRDI